MDPQQLSAAGAVAGIMIGGAIWRRMERNRRARVASAPGTVTGPGWVASVPWYWRLWRRVTRG